MFASLRVQTLRKDALFFQTPIYLLQKEPRAARGLPAMSSLLALVRKQLKNHPALIPLFIFIGGGATMSMLYLSRLALKNPDVSWDRKNNPEPWNKIEPTQQYKLFAFNIDYSKLKKDRPDF